jgi:alginate O-acetyltransferase complex protein AlgJ
LVVNDSEQSRVATQQTLPPVHEAWLPREHSLHRPRHAKRQPTALICALVFFCTPLLLLILGVRPEAIENRKLASFPSLGDGWEFFARMSPWATDYLPLRGDAIGAEDWISRTLFGEPPPLGTQNKNQGPGVVAPPASQDDREQQAAGFPTVIEGKDDWLYYGDDISLACKPDRPLDETIAAIGKLRAAVESSGRKFVLIVAPNKSTMVPEFLPDRYAGATCSREARSEFWQRIVVDSRAVDVRSVLYNGANNIGAPLYSKMDSHWTFAGAISMTAAIAEHIERGVTATWKVTPAKLTDRPGDLPPLLGQKSSDKLQSYDLAPDGQKVLSKLIYPTFNEPLEFTQPASKGVVTQSVGLVADSFTLPATPYLAAAFTNISIVHTELANADPGRMGAMLATKDVVVVEAAERSLVGGRYPLLTDNAINAIAAELAKAPRR